MSRMPTCARLVLLASGLTILSLMVLMLQLGSELAALKAQVYAAENALVVSDGSGNTLELRGDNDMQVAQPLRGSRGSSPRRLAKLGMVDWTLATRSSGCVRIDMLSVDPVLDLDTKACNSHACPPCFGLTSIPGSMVLHTATFRGCSAMYVSESQQLGSGPFAGSLQQLEFVNLNSQDDVAISDGISDFIIPAGGYVMASCTAQSTNELHLDRSLQRFVRPGSTFFPATTSATWIKRANFAVVVRADGAILVMGGWTGLGGGAAFANDVHCSADGGFHWIQLTSSAAWSSRADFPAVVRLDGAVLVLGGLAASGQKNDVYSSSDGGSTWKQMTASAMWSPRQHHKAVALTDGTILVLGGSSALAVATFYNDVHSSSDGGATWTLVASNTIWNPRNDFGLVVRHDGAMVLMGGRTAAGDLNDVYSSVDGGSTWEILSNAALWSPRVAFQTLVRTDGSILLLGGGSGVSRYNDAYSSADGGYTWTTLTSVSAWSPRWAFRAAVRHDGAVVLMGGLDEVASFLNDVYISET